MDQSSTIVLSFKKKIVYKWETAKLKINKTKVSNHLKQTTFYKNNPITLIQIDYQRTIYFTEYTFKIVIQQK